MRTDTALFNQKNKELSKRPRYVIELAFDSANTILWYFTSHSDAALPGGGSAIQAVVEGISGTSQTLNPDTANASIGNISFNLVDKSSIVTDTLGDQLVLGRSTRRQRVRVYIGYEGLAWADYTLVQTQLVTQIDYDEGTYKFSCADIQREMRKDLFELKTTTLAASLSSTATTVEVFSTAAFSMVAHGTSYSDAPSSTVGYIRIQDEVIRYTGKTSTQFTGCTRGALNTRPVEHAVDLTIAADRRTEVEEYVYLEMPAVKLMYALLTGVLHNQGGATLPANWHLGIPTTYVQLSDFTGIGNDLWNPSDDVAGFHVRFEGLDDTDGKKFIETELALLTGVFMPIYASGAVGLRRMANILAGSSYVAMLDETNLVRVGPLRHDFNSLHNVLQINWNWEKARENFTRINLLLDSSSSTIHGKADPLRLKFLGLHGSRHSAIILSQRFDMIRDRYTGPPLRIDVEVLPSLNSLEVGDVVRLRPPGVRDFVANGPLDRSFEIQNIAIDWLTGTMSLKLFGSSQAPAAIAPTADTTVLSNAWYTSVGTALSTQLTITGSNPGHVTAGGTLTGVAGDLNASGSIFYYDGDLVVDPGVNINIVHGVQLRVKGFFQNNGTINGKGNGHAGAAARSNVGFAPQPEPQSHNDGTPGFIGNTQAGGRQFFRQGFITGVQHHSNPAPVVSGIYSTIPSFNLSWNGTTLSGMPSDLRGSSGSSGMHLVWVVVTGGESLASYAGGAGGDGGAGLSIVCRGFAQGVAGKIDLSGDDGVRGQTLPLGSGFLYSSSGAGGAPGGLLIVLDGVNATATGLTDIGFVALQGRTFLVPRDQFFIPNEGHFDGTGDGTTFPLPNLSNARGGSRVQYVPSNVAATADPNAVTLLSPSNLGLASGTDELLMQSDGTLIVRIKLTWTPSTDARTVAYEAQFKPSSESIWQTAPPFLGQATNTAWIAGVRDGINYDVRLRAAGPTREVSDWITIQNYQVVGKTEPPDNVGALSFTDPFLSWPENTDFDRRGYIVKYHAGANNDWATATAAHQEGFITETRFDTGAIVGGSTTMLVKALDTSGNESATATSLLVDLRPVTPTAFSISRQPDGTREITWSTLSPPQDFDGVRVRYFLGTTSDWEAMTPLHTGILKASPFETNQLAAGTYTFAAKNVDKAGNESDTAIFISTVTLADPRIAGALDDIKEEPTWTGTKTSCHVDTATGWLVADGTATWSTIPATWAPWTFWNATPVSPITYVRLIDIGVIASFIPLVTVLADGSQTIEEQHSDDGISYTAYAAMGPQLTTRFVRIRVTVTGSYPKIKTMRTILSAQTLTEYIEDQNSASLTGAYDLGVGDIRVPITEDYAFIRKVDITLQSVGPGWSWELIDKDTTVGPRIKIYNSSNVAADAVFDATVIGIPL